jgi:hypothetical protein
MGDVVRLPCLTTLPLDPDEVLTANVGKFEEVLVLGFAKDGAFIAAASRADLDRMTFFAQKFIHKVNAGDYDHG